ncbi:ABC transporter substrate-binding protein [Candidatus Poribacteria bacterium]
MKAALVTFLACFVCLLAIDQAAANPDISNDELHRAYGDPPDLLNPLISNDTTSGTFLGHTTESFASRRVQDPNEWEPFLAEEWKSSETDDGKLVFDVKLREGVKWHKVTVKTSDGVKTIEPVEFTSKDVVFSYRVFMNPSVRCPHIRSYYTDLESVKRRGRYRVIFTWSKKYFLAEQTTLYFPIIPEHIYSMKEDGSPMPADPSSEEFGNLFNGHWSNNWICGTGSYVLETYEPNERVVFARNEDYWGKKPFYRKFVYHRIQEDTKAYLTFLKGDLDTQRLNPKQYEEIQERDEFKSEKIKTVLFDRPGYLYLGWNLNKAIFRDKRTRWAFAHAMPRDKIIETILRGLATPTDGPFNIHSNAYDRSLPSIAYDPDKARILLEQVGWVDSDGDGIREKNIEGKRIDLDFSIIIIEGSETFRKISEVLRSEYGKIGAKIEISPLPWGQFLNVLKERSFDACILGWSLGWKQDPNQIWNSAQADEPDSSNHISYRNKDVDKLIEELRYTLDEEKQTELYHKIHRLIYEDQPYCFLWVGKAIAAYNSRLSGVKYYSTIRPGYDEREWSTFPGMERVR